MSNDPDDTPALELLATPAPITANAELVADAKAIIDQGTPVLLPYEAPTLTEHSVSTILKALSPPEISDVVAKLEAFINLGGSEDENQATVAGLATGAISYLMEQDPVLRQVLLAGRTFGMQFVEQLNAAAPAAAGDIQ